MGYLVRGPGDGVIAFAQRTGPKRAAVLWITARAPNPLPDGVEVLLIQEAPGPIRSARPGRLADLRAAAVSFLDENPGGYVLLDAVDLLVVRNGVERTVRAIEAIHDDVATRRGVLLVCVPVAGVNARLLAWLERELDEFVGIRDEVPAALT